MCSRDASQSVEEKCIFNRWPKLGCLNSSSLRYFVVVVLHIKTERACPVVVLSLQEFWRFFLSSIEYIFIQRVRELVWNNQKYKIQAIATVVGNKTSCCYKAGEEKNTIVCFYSIPFQNPPPFLQLRETFPDESSQNVSVYTKNCNQSTYSCYIFFWKPHGQLQEV